MIAKRTCFCTLFSKDVDAIVEEVKKGRGKNAETIHNFLDCTNSGQCDKAALCKFINPLSNRMPLEVKEPVVQQ